MTTELSSGGNGDADKGLVHVPIPAGAPAPGGTGEKKMRHPTAFAALLSGTSLSACAAEGNLLRNGDFEDGQAAPATDGGESTPDGSRSSS